MCIWYLKWYIKIQHEQSIWNYFQQMSLQHLLQPWFSEDPQRGFIYYVFSVCWLTTSPKHKIHLISVKCYLSDLSRFSQGYRVGLIHPCFRVTSVWDSFNIHRHNSNRVFKFGKENLWKSQSLITSQNEVFK